MIAFDDPVHAVRCAVGIQRAFAERALTAEVPLRVRIGVHAGAVVRELDDFFGRDVNLAARIAGAAEGGEVLVSAALKDRVAEADEFTFDEGRDLELKGLEGAHRVHHVIWRGPADHPGEDSA